MQKILIIFVFLQLFFIVGCSSNTARTNQPVDLQTAAKLNVQLGLGYLKEGQIPRAQEKLSLAITQAPKMPETQLAMGYFLLSIGEIDRAKRYYTQALKLAPQSGEIQDNYGVFLCRTGNYREAINYFLTAAENPNYLETAAAYENAGLCALKIPDKKLAVKYFSKALHYDANRDESRLELKRLG